MKTEPSKKRILSPADRKKRSRRLNLGLMAMAIVWGLIMVTTHEVIFVRWFAAAVLFAVGLTGFFGIGTERFRQPKQ